MVRQFQDRFEAGRLLAGRLNNFAHRVDLVVLGVPRGGVPVAYEVALALGAPLDVFVVRKMCVPGQKELTMGAVAPEGVIVLNDDIVHKLKIPARVVEIVAADERQVLLRREAAYRGERPALDVADRTVILVDDGLASGMTLRAAAQALRRRRPARIIAAIPVAAPEACGAVRQDVDEIMFPVETDLSRTIASWYNDFPQTSDDEVHALLNRANRPWTSTAYEEDATDQAASVSEPAAFTYQY